LGVAGAFALAFWLLPHDAEGVRQLADAPVGLLAAGALAAWLLLTPAMVSGTLLAVATGVLVDGPAGLALAGLGAVGGSVAAFLLARRLGRGPADALAGPRVQRLRERIERRPLLTIVLVRLAPGSPAGLLNYAAGMTRIRLRHFAAGIAIGGAPRVVLYAALGGAFL
jgi:uncharacterized membrane protein YdjX (TVP38/TMEM64 family)